jgi:hypothetical protein
MKDILCVATFASKLLCLVAFVLMLKPHGISPVEPTTKPQACELGACASAADAEILLTASP